MLSPFADKAKNDTVAFATKPVAAAEAKKGVEVVAGCAKCSAADHAAFVAELNEDEANEHKLNVVSTWKEGRLFSVAQIKAVLETLTSVKTRVAIVEMLGPRATDAKHGSQIVDMFKYQAEKETCKRG